MAYSMGYPAYSYSFNGVEYVGFFIKSGSGHKNPNSVFNMLKDLPDLSKRDMLKESIGRFEEWQEDPKFPERKKK